MNLAELDQLIARLESELEEAKAARPFILKYSKIESASTSPVHAQPPLVSVSPGYGSAVTAIRKAINECGVEYSVFNIEEKLIGSGTPMKRTAISQALSRMKEELIIKTPASGRKPTIYTKIKPQPEAKKAA